MTMNVQDVVLDDDFLTLYDLWRFAPGARDIHGDYTPGTKVPTLGLKAAIQASKNADIVRFVPEGERSSDSITIYSALELRRSSGDDQEQSDVVYWQGGYYRVQYSKPWQVFGYWFVIATQFLPKPGVYAVQP